MNESISRAAGTPHGQESAPSLLEGLIARAGRQAEQRTTLYARAPEGQRERSLRAPPLTPIVLTPLKARARAGRNSVVTSESAIP